MRILMYISAVIAAAAFAFGCAGTRDDSSLPFLKASVTEVDLAAGTAVEFIVTYEGVDVTDESTFFMEPAVRTEDSAGPIFYPETEGSYTFCAVYEGKESNKVTVKVVNSAVERPESKYERHVLLVEFTGAWCSVCPSGFSAMMEKLDLPSMREYKDYVHLAAFHSETDALAIPETDDFFKLFKDYGLAYPSFVTDWRIEDGQLGNLKESGIDFLVPSIKASFDRYSAHCGVAVRSELNGDKSEASVTVKVSSELTAEYRVMVLVVEDKIKSMQLNPPLYPDGQEDYIHKHVVRKVVTSYVGRVFGEKLDDDGEIMDGEEKSKVWSFNVDKEWNLENTEIYALAFGIDGSVNNMNFCAIDNGDSGYKLKE